MENRRVFDSNTRFPVFLGFWCNLIIPNPYILLTYLFESSSFPTFGDLQSVLAVCRLPDVEVSSECVNVQ